MSRFFTLPDSPTKAHEATGNDRKLVHMELLYQGAYAEVHKIYDKKLKQAFARKLIRPFGSVTRDDIEQEIRAILAICNNNEHENIIAVLRHGDLAASKFYFIDMELCDLNLDSYIRGKRDVEKSKNNTVFVQQDSPPPLWMQNIWTIMSHIAAGLKFIHLHKYVHRDLKPRNILYCREKNLWKIVDFGISSPGTSRRALTTRYGRGTDGYRAPELLADDDATAKFTNKVDLWALGCILYELVTGRKAFREDFHVVQHYKTNDIINMDSIPNLPTVFPLHVEEIFHELIHRQQEKRPSATEFLPILQSYITVLSSIDCLSSSQNSLTTMPTYSQWKGLVQAYQEGEGDVFSRWAGWYLATGNPQSAITLLTCLILDPLHYQIPRVTQLKVVYTELGDWSGAVNDWAKLLNLQPNNPEFRHYLSLFLAATKDPAFAMRVWRGLLEKHPKVGFFSFAEEVFNHIVGWEDQVLWLEYFVTFPHQSFYQHELEKMLTDEKYNRNPSGGYSEDIVFEEIWTEIMKLVRSCRDDLDRKLYSSKNHQSVRSLSEALTFKHYQMQVLSLQRKYIPETDPELDRLSLLQQIARATAASGGDKEIYDMWDCVVDFIQDQMRPMLDQIAELKEALDTLVRSCAAVRNPPLNTEQQIQISYMISKAFNVVLEHVKLSGNPFPQDFHGSDLGEKLLSRIHTRSFTKTSSPTPPWSTLAACGRGFCILKALARPLSQKRDLGRVEAVALEDAVCKVRAQFLDAIAVAWTEDTKSFEAWIKTKGDLYSSDRVTEWFDAWHNHLSQLIKALGSIIRFESGNDAGEFALSKVPEGIICNFAKIFEGMILGILQKARSITYFPALHGDSGTYQDVRNAIYEFLKLTGDGIPSLEKLFEKVLSVTGHFERIAKEMDAACVNCFASRGIKDMRTIVHDGIRRENWSSPTATIDVSPYVFELLSWVSVLHHEIKSADSFAILTPCIESFRQIPSFSGPGMIRAKLNTEVLFQLFSVYHRKAARDTTLMIYSTIKSVTYTAVRDVATLQQDMDRAKEILRRVQVKLTAKYPCFLGDGSGEDPKESIWQVEAIDEESSQVTLSEDQM